MTIAQQIKALTAKTEGLNLPDYPRDPKEIVKERKQKRKEKQERRLMYWQ